MGGVIKKTTFLVNKYNAVITIVLFGLLLFFGGLFSYAYFTANVQGSGKQITISTSDAIVHFTDNNEINETGITPGTTITKTFYVTNTASGSLQYKINWEYLINNFTYRNCLKYTITSTGGGGSLSSTQVPDSEDHINIINNITIPGNTTQNYTMTITYEDNGQNQDADKNKSLIGKIEVTDIEGTSIAPQTSTGTYNGTVTSTSTLYGFSMGQLMKQIYPVGSIYTSTDNTDPSELFPGTVWERYGQGKTLVGLNENDTSFNTVGKTGGTKDAVIPYHRHDLNGTNAQATNSNDSAHVHTISGTAASAGSHEHTIPANTITMNTQAQTISTVGPNEVTGEYEDGVNYGEHTHSVSATGKNTNTYTITSSGAHTHSTTAKTGLTTGSESAHTHGFTVPALSGSTSSTSKTLTGQWYNTTARFPGTNTVSGIVTKVSGSISTYWDNTGGTDTNTYGWKIDATHSHNITTTAKSGNTTGAGSSHSHSFSIPALDIESSGDHTHSIPANAISVSVTGTTSVDNHAGAHIHDINLPSLTSGNTSSITIPSAGTHTHDVNGSTISGEGRHTHSLSGYSTYAGTSGNVTNANLQPYITVYMWKRVS